MPLLPYSVLVRAILASRSTPTIQVATADLKLSRATGVAPCGIVFSAVDTLHPLTSNPFRDLIYFFDFGDGSTAVYTHGELAGMRKDRFLGGPVSVYVYETPGTYTARVWAYDGTTLSLPASKTVTIQDPNVVYAGAATIVVSTSGNFAGAPAGAVQVTSSDFDAVASTHAVSNKRLLLRDDEVFLASVSSNRSACVNFTMGRFGGGSAKPIIRATANGVSIISGFTGGGNIANSPNNWTVSEIRFESGGFTGCDGVSTGLMAQVGGSGEANIKNLIYGYFTTHKCEFSGLRISASANGIGNVISACSITNVSNSVATAGSVGLWGGENLWLGVSDTLIDNGYGGEHCLRVQGIDYFAEISNTYKKPAPTKNYSTCRGWGTTLGFDASYLVRSYNRFDAEGITTDTASAYMHTGPSNTTSNHPMRDVIIEGNFFNKVAALGAANAIEVCARRTAIRGNVINMANTVSSTSVQLSNPNATMSVSQGDHEVTRNTIYSTTVQGFSGITIQNQVTQVVSCGNLVYAPNATKDESGNGSLPKAFTGLGIANSGNVYQNNTPDAQVKTLNPVFYGPLSTKFGFKLQENSPYIGYVTASSKMWADSLGFLRNPSPFDGGALNNVGEQVDAWSLIDTSTVIPSLASSRDNGVAPMGVMFSATETTTDAPGVDSVHDLLYFYDFGDGSEAEVYTYGQLMGQRSDKYIGGPVVTHTYTKPGVYAPRVWVWNGTTMTGPTNLSQVGPTSSASTGIITVQDPNLAYPGAATVAVSTSGNFTGAPVGSTQITSSDYSAVMSAHAASNKRILFREGETFTFGATVSKGGTVGLMVSSFGVNGGKATFNPTAAGLSFLNGIANGNNPANNPDRWILTNVNLVGTAYPDTKWVVMNGIADATGDANIKLLTKGNMTIHDVTISDGDGVGSLAGYGNVVNKCVSQRVNNGVVTSGRIGVYLYGLMSGVSNSKFDPEHGGEHCIRTHCERVAIQSNYTARPAATKHHITVRGIGVSVQTNGVTTDYANVEYNLIDGSLDSQSIIEPTTCRPTNSNQNEDIRNVRWCSNYFKGIQAQKVLSVGARKFSFRNNVVEIAAGSSGVTIVEIGNPNAYMTAIAETFFLEANTARSAGTNGFSFVNLQSAVRGARVRDNIAYAPGAGTNIFVHVSSTGVSPEFANNSSNAQITGTDPLFVGAAGVFNNSKLQSSSPYVNTVVAKRGRKVDAAGMTLGTLPNDAGALNNTGKQLSSTTLIPEFGPKTFLVTLSSIVGGNQPSVQATVTINNVGNLNPVITANRVSGVGPLFVQFDALKTQIAPSLSSMPLFDVYYDWNFGDATAAGQVWNEGTKAGTASRNTSFGPIAGHVFDNAGTYTVTLRARFRGINGVLVTKTTTTTVTVAAESTLSTVYVSNTALPVAGQDGVPAGANVQLVTSWASLGTLSATYKRILLRAGESWNTDGPASMSQGPGLLGKYGSGAKPSITVVYNDAAVYFNGTSDWRVQDLYITGNGVQGNSKRFIIGGPGSLGQGGKYLIQRVEMNDMLMGIGLGGYGVAVVDCYIHDTYDASQGMGGICMYSSNVFELAVLGSRFSRSPATHCVRLQGTATTVIQHSRFESAGGGRNALTIRGIGGTPVEGNPYIPWSGTWTENVLVSDNVIDNSLTSGNGYALYCGPQAIGHAERLRNVIVERNYIAGRDAQSANFQVVSGLRVRGNLIVSRNGTAVGLGLGGNEGGSPATTDAIFENNTIYKPDTSVVNAFSAFYLSDPGLGSGLVIRNTLVYAPGNTKDGATNGTQATMYVQGGTQGNEGTQFTLEANSNTSQLNSSRPWAAVTPSVYSDYAPNGYGVNSGVFVPMFTDFFNVEITGTRDMGAIQV